MVRSRSASEARTSMARTAPVGRVKHRLFPTSDSHAVRRDRKARASRVWAPLQACGQQALYARSERRFGSVPSMISLSAVITSQSASES